MVAAFAETMSNYREIRPSPRLARYVECYWHRDDRQGTPQHRVLPDACVDILFSRRGSEPVSLSIVGLMTSPLTLDIVPGQFFFGVRFRAGMAGSFLPEIASLIDQTVPVAEIMGAAGRTLFEQFAESSGPENMIAISEKILRPLEPPDSAERFLSNLSMPGVSLDDLSAQSGLSARHLRRESLRRTGVSPKYLRRIIRFRYAVERIEAAAAAPAQPSWAQFAAACGYYDQAHFTREFLEFAGCTPGRFLQSRQKRDS